MRTVDIEPCAICGTPTNYYDGMMGRRCSSCEWDAVYNFKIGLAQRQSNSYLMLDHERILSEDDGSCVLGKNKQEWLDKEPPIKTFPVETKINRGLYNESIP